MEKVRLGKTNMMVSKLGFGSIPIQRDAEDEAIAIIRRCLDLGITYIDTANGYTTSEERIGKAISGRRQGVILATKSLARTREDLEKHLKLSLKRLSVDYIDLYQFHNISNVATLDIVLAPDGPMTVVQEAKKAGLIKHIGVTSHQIDVAKKAVKSGRFETIMFPFNFLAPEVADELLPLTREHDVGFIAMKPLAGGMIDNATIAFKYLFQFPDVVPIPGIQKIKEIEEIVQVLEGPLQMTEPELCEMERIRKELGTRFCHRCDYCQPCTAEIPISLVLPISILSRRVSPQQTFTGATVQMMEKAAGCQDCGECEKRCPYHLPIRQMIAEQVKWFQEEKRKYLEQISSG